jgi:acetylornithine/N-succinyldiaminopimelate aminotransferase
MSEHSEPEGRSPDPSRSQGRRRLPGLTRLDASGASENEEGRQPVSRAGDEAGGPLMPTYPPPPVTFVRGEGTQLWDDEGRRYLDLLSGIAVVSLGHSHPEVADAVSTQVRTLQHVSNLFGTEIGPEVATMLDGLLGGGGQVFFTNSGAEANECALKLARKWAGHGRHVVVSAYGSFHGRTLATLHATGQPAKHEAFQPLPEGFRHTVFDDVADLERAIDPTVAAVMLEVVQGEGGVNPMSPGHLADVRRLCDERNLLLILDEVQTGLGRTGKWFAHQHHDVVPDVVTMAKALGNGMPIGACWARRDVAGAFVPGDHATTFGGQPLAASAARAVLAVMARDDLPGRAAKVGEHLQRELAELPGVSGVRGLGLLIGAELVEGLDARAVQADALAAGVVINAVTPTTLRLTPPLTIDSAEIDEALSILGGVLSRALASSGDA